jgi:hypothetical protein
MMRRFPWCFPSRKRVVKEDSDSERAESPAFVTGPDPVADLPFGNLHLRESPDSYPAPSRVMTDLWCDKTTTTLPVSSLWIDAAPVVSRRTYRPDDDMTITVSPTAWTPRPRLGDTIALPANDETVTVCPRPPRDWAFTRTGRGREFPSYKDVEKRKNPCTDLPAEKKARTEPSSYVVPVSESDSD